MSMLCDSDWPKFVTYACLPSGERLTPFGIDPVAATCWTSSCGGWAAAVALQSRSDVTRRKRFMGRFYRERMARARNHRSNRVIDTLSFRSHGDGRGWNAHDSPDARNRRLPAHDAPHPRG